MPSGYEWIIVLVVVLVIFGGSQLPKLARNLGKAQKEFKDGLSEGEREAQQRAAEQQAAAIDPAVERTDVRPET
jgi:sec-independent protein translocase protein TatA